MKAYLITLLMGALLIACEPVDQTSIDNIEGTWFCWDTDSSVIETFHFEKNGVMRYSAQSNKLGNMVDAWGGNYVKFNYEFYPNMLKFVSQPMNEYEETFKFRTRYEIIGDTLTIWRFPYYGRYEGGFKKVVLLKQ